MASKKKKNYQYHYCERHDYYYPIECEECKNNKYIDKNNSKLLRRLNKLPNDAINGFDYKQVKDEIRHWFGISDTKISVTRCADCLLNNHVVKSMTILHVQYYRIDATHSKCTLVICSPH